MLSWLTLIVYVSVIDNSWSYILSVFPKNLNLIVNNNTPWFSIDSFFLNQNLLDIKYIASIL